MKREVAFKVLNDRLSRDIERENDEMVELIQDYLIKLNKFTNEQFENQFKQDLSFNEIRIFLDMNSPKITKKTIKKTKETYYKFVGTYDRVTEKAFGIVTGTNGQNGSNYREFIEWVPFSQVMEENNNTYIPTWLVRKNNLWDFINKNETITKSL